MHVAATLGQGGSVPRLIPVTIHHTVAASVSPHANKADEPSLVEPPKDTKKLLIAVLSYITASTKLSYEQKLALTRLGTAIDGDAHAAEQAMMDVLGLAKRMEALAERRYGPSTLASWLASYGAFGGGVAHWLEEGVMLDASGDAQRAVPMLSIAA